MIRVTSTKAGRKRYAARVHLGGGKYKLLATRDTRAEAKRDEAEWEMQRRTPERVLGRDFVKGWLAAYAERVKPSSAGTAQGAVKGWLKTFGNRSLRSITRDEAREWAASHRSSVAVIVTMFNEALADGFVERNVFRGTAKRSAGRRHMTPLTVAEVNKLAQAARQNCGEAGKTMEAFVLVAAYSGMRLGELCALRWDAIDFQRSRIRVSQRVYRGTFDLPKGGKVREITLLPEARAALLSLDRSEDWVFVGKRGGPLTQSKVSLYLEPACTAFGRKITPHELRHFCGHHLYATLGYPARLVAAQLTHSSPRLVEDLYGHGDVGALEEIEATYAARRAERTNVVPFRRASDG